VKETGDLEKEKGGKKDKNSRSEFTRILPGFFLGKDEDVGKQTE